jgi:hypothetical protein
MVNLPNLMGKSQVLMGKSTISMAIFNSKLLNYQRVVHPFLGLENAAKPPFAR